MRVRERLEFTLVCKGKRNERPAVFTAVTVFEYYALLVSVLEY